MSVDLVLKMIHQTSVRQEFKRTGELQQFIFVAVLAKEASSQGNAKNSIDIEWISALSMVGKAISGMSVSFIDSQDCSPCPAS